MTAGASAVSFSGTRPDDWPKSTVEPVIVQGGLVAPPSWSESLDLLEGRLRVGGVSFELRDPPDTFGGPAGTSYNVMTWMASRQASLASTPLLFSSGSIAADATTINVADGSIFGASNFTIWIDREAIRISSRAGGVLTVDTSAAVGRGILGSKARAHRVVADASYAAEVFSSYPGPAFARCVLWVGVVNSSNALVDPIPVLRTRVQHAPRLKSGGGIEGGTRWELACDHVASLLNKVMLGANGEACRASGYIVDNAAMYKPIWARLAITGFAGVAATSNVAGAWPAPTSSPTRYDTLDQYVAAMNEKLRTDLSAAGITTHTMQVAVFGGMSIRCAGDVTMAGVLGIRVDWTVHVAGREDTTSSTNTTGTTGRGFLNATSVPAAMQPIRQGTTGTDSGDASWLHVNTTANLTSAAYAALTESGVPYAGASMSTLFSGGNDYYIWLDSLVSGRATVTIIDSANQRIRGAIRARDKNGVMIRSIPGVIERYAGGNGFSASLLGEVSFTQGINLSHGSWVYGIKHGIINDTIYAGTPHEFDVDARDWEWTYALETTNDTPAQLRRRDWILTGEQSLNDLLEECCQFAGAVPTLRRSQISIRTVRPPLRSDVADSAHTLSYSAGTILDKGGWQENREGIANVGVFKLGDDDTKSVTVQVNAQRSLARYGAQRQIELKVRGIAVTAELLAEGARSIANFFTRRIEGLWSEPTNTITVAVPLYLLDSIYHLDVVKLTHWLTPNGRGSRSLSSDAAIVVGRTPEPKTARMILELMRWPHFANISGFAPCCRVSSIAAGVLTIATAYANGSDYAGSNQTGYANTTRGTVANDGGAGYFVAGDKVELVERGNTAPRAPDSFTVQSVNTGTPSITLTGSPAAAWQTIITGGGIVDIRFDDYATSGLQTAQKTWAWIAARATRVIGGTTDDRFRWAP